MIVRDAELAVVKHGTANQQERYAAGLLPEDELAQLARDQLFGEFKGFPRWALARNREQMIRELKHERGCVRRDGDHLEYEETELTELGAAEWDLFKAITLAASRTNQRPDLDAAACKLDGFTHWVTCKECGAEVFRSSVKVTIAWAGRELVREYAVDPARYDEMKRGLR